MSSVWNKAKFTTFPLCWQYTVLTTSTYSLILTRTANASHETVCTFLKQTLPFHPLIHNFIADRLPWEQQLVGFQKWFDVISSCIKRKKKLVLTWMSSMFHSVSHYKLLSASNITQNHSHSLPVTRCFRTGQLLDFTFFLNRLKSNAFEPC